MKARPALFTLAIVWLFAGQTLAAEAQRALFASVGNWQIVRSSDGNKGSCLIQSVYDGHVQLAFGIFGQPAATEIFVYADDLALQPGSRGQAMLHLVGLKRNAFEMRAPFVVQSAHLARIKTSSSVYRKMLTLQQDNDSLHVDLAGRQFVFALSGTIDIMPDYMKCLNQLP
jgi:hypothetical protein